MRTPNFLFSLFFCTPKNTNLFIEDGNTDRLAHAVNILAIKKGYKVVSNYAVVHSQYVIMEKKEER